MAKNFTCSSCAGAFDTLHQSYVDASWQCAACALSDPFLNKQQAARLRVMAAKDKTSARRAEIARANFHHEEVTA